MHFFLWNIYCTYYISLFLSAIMICHFCVNNSNRPSRTDSILMALSAALILPMNHKQGHLSLLDTLSQILNMLEHCFFFFTDCVFITKVPCRDYFRKRKKSDSILCQNPQHQQKIEKTKWQRKNATKMFNFTAIADDFKRSVGVTTATGAINIACLPTLPSFCKNRAIERTCIKECK